MRDRWQGAAAKRLTPLDALVYRSRLIGAEDGLGLYGGGNTSIKCVAPDLLGRPQEVLWVKGSGADLKGCRPAHFSPLRLDDLRQLARRASMSDEAMVAFLERCLLAPRAPRPSIETLLHALIPEAAVDHTHADAMLGLANTRRGEALVRRVLGERLLWIPYIQPGFALSRRVAEAYRRQPGSHGAVLAHHGLITWGPDGATSYRRTIEYVTRAERYLGRQRRRHPLAPAGAAAAPEERLQVLRAVLPALRGTLSRTRRVCISFTDTPDVLAFVSARRLPALARIGPATPDHMLRTKRVPLVLQGTGHRAGRDPSAAIERQVARYVRAHERYVRRFGQRGQRVVDPFPRVIVLPRVGLLTTGKDATEAGMVAQLYRHAIAIMRDAEAAGGYTSVSPREAFNVEYWPLELYKLSLAPPEQELARLVGLVTGGAGGIGRAIARHLIERGASVVVTDLDGRAAEAVAASLNAQAGRQRALGLAMDVTNEASIRRAFDQLLRYFGGLDFLVSNAGTAHVAAIEQLRRADWESSLAVNATGHFLVSQAAVRWLRAQGLGGAIVFIASKNVLAPGKDFGAYSAAKAAQTQLARVLAIEHGRHGIRVNVVNPDGVFEGSGLWRRIGASRAASHGVRPDQLPAFYRRRNLLQAAVLPEDVAEAVGFLVSARAAKTTGCLLAVDGGLREAFPR
jgi:rhamnulose-1-phosphate aldolase/alcohol dehydrogenase